MYHADPWDEIARLEKEMEVELLARLERPRSIEPEGFPAGERESLERTSPRPFWPGRVTRRESGGD